MIFSKTKSLPTVILVLLEKLEILQRLDEVEIFLAMLRHLIAPGLDDVVYDDQRLVDVPPVLSVVIEPLPQHLHDIRERQMVVRHIGDFRH